MSTRPVEGGRLRRDDLTRPPVRLGVVQDVGADARDRVDGAGTAEHVEFTVVPGQFAYHDGQMQERVDEGEVVLLTGPSSGSLGEVSVRIAGDAAP